MIRTDPGAARAVCDCCRAGWQQRLAAFLLAAVSWSAVYAADPPAADGAATDEFTETTQSPFWAASEITEPMLFLHGKGKGSERPTSKLLFLPTEVVAVRSATRETVFESGKDFEVDMAEGIVSLPEGSRIPSMTEDQLYPLMTSEGPKIARQGGDKTRGIFFGEGAAYHKLQAAITYRFKPGSWKGPAPRSEGSSIPKTLAKLKSKQPITLLLCGDSISAGANASLESKSSPFCPAYGQLTAQTLEKYFGSPVKFINHAVGGWTSANGLQQAKDARIGKESPDLVIVAFGMNDVFQRNADAYQKNIQGIMDTVRADAPDAEFILVASMLGNREWGMPMEQFPLYRDALAKLCGPGVVLVDMTSMWQALLERKSFYDLTGNGVNHPNDFGHCVYAECIFARVAATPTK